MSTPSASVHVRPQRIDTNACIREGVINLEFLVQRFQVASIYIILLCVDLEPDPRFNFILSLRLFSLALALEIESVFVVYFG